MKMISRCELLNNRVIMNYSSLQKLYCNYSQQRSSSYLKPERIFILIEKKHQLFFLMLAIISSYILLMFILLWLGDFKEQDSYRNLDSYIQVSIKHPDGSITDYPGNDFSIVHKGDEVTAVIHLPTKLYMRDSALCFHVNNSIMNLYYQKQILYRYGLEPAIKGEQIGSVYARVPIPEEAWGKELRLVCKVQEDTAYSSIHDVYVMEKINSLRYFLLSGTAGYMIFSTLLIFCTLGFIFLLFVKKRPIIYEGMLICSFCIAFSLWFLGYHGFLNLISIRWSFNNNAEYVGLFLFPPLFFAYLYKKELPGIHKRILGGLALGAGILFAGATCLNFLTENYHYVKFLQMQHIWLTAGILMTIILDLSAKHHHSDADLILRYGMLFFILTLCFELVIYNMDKYFGTHIRTLFCNLSAIGMLVFIVTMMMHYVLRIMNYVLIRKEHDMLEKLAYTDQLTKLSNRTACFQYFSTIQKNQDYALCFFDLNGLKKVNDLLGHELGDQFIITFANILHKVFAQAGRCFRMGGDEFIAVIAHEQHHPVGHLIEDLILEIDAFNASNKQPFQLSASWGVCKNDLFHPLDIQELMNQADEKMYQNKIAYKKAHAEDYSEDRTFLRDV